MEPSPLPKDFKGAQIYFKDPTPGDVKDTSYHGERPAKDGRDLLVVQVVELHRLRIEKVKVLSLLHNTSSIREERKKAHPKHEKYSQEVRGDD